MAEQLRTLAAPGDYQVLILGTHVVVHNCL